MPSMAQEDTDLYVKHVMTIVEYIVLVIYVIHIMTLRKIGVTFQLLKREYRSVTGIFLI